MPDPLTISLGGDYISLIPDSAAGHFEIAPKTARFISQERGNCVLHIHCGTIPGELPFDTTFDTGLAWKIGRVGGRVVIKVNPPGSSLYMQGAFAPDFCSGDIHVSPSLQDPQAYLFPLAYPLGELFMMQRLGLAGGMLCHAAGVIYEGGGYLFTGHGGAGKTTTARLWADRPGVLVVNDDKVILRRTAAGFRLYGTPWHGEGGMALPDSAPLRGIFVLKQAPSNEAHRLSIPESTACLLARGFVPLWEGEKISLTLGFLEDLCREVPCWELGFVPESSAVDFVCALLGECERLI